MQNDTIKKIEVELRTQRQLFIQGLIVILATNVKIQARNARAAQYTEATEELGSSECLFIN